MFHLMGKQCTFLNQPLLVSTGFDAGNPGRSSWFLTGGCQKKDKRKTDINEPHLTMCPSSSLFYSNFSVMEALKDRMLRLMVGLQWIASHESILLPRGWLISADTHFPHSMNQLLITVIQEMTNIKALKAKIWLTCYSTNSISSLNLFHKVW